MVMPDIHARTRRTAVVLAPGLSRRASKQASAGVASITMAVAGCLLAVSAFVPRRCVVKAPGCRRRTTW